MVEPPMNSENMRSNFADSMAPKNSELYSSRLMTLADLPAIVQLEQTTQLDPWTEAQVLEMADFLRSGEYVGVVLSGAQNFTQIDAYIFARVFLDECEILSVGVHPDVQGKGLGRALLHAFFQSLPAAARIVHLEVRASNTAARRLYARAGFVEVGLRKGYYAGTEQQGLQGSSERFEREDAVLMSKTVEYFAPHSKPKNTD